MLEEGDAVALSGEDALKSLRETAKSLKQDIVDFSNVREWGSGDPSVGSADIMKLLERGSNNMKAVVRAGAAARSRIQLERSLSK